MQVRFENKQGQVFQQSRAYSKHHLSTISSLLEQLQTRTNTSVIKQIWANVESVQSVFTHEIQTLSKQAKKSNSYYLSLKQIEESLKGLAESFSQVLEEFPNRRIQSLYSQVLHISFRLRTMQPTSIHTHSTRMKQHLLEQLKDEKKRRDEMEREYASMTEEYQKLAEVSASKLNEKENVIQEYNKIQSKLIELSHEMNLLRQTNGKLKSVNEGLRREKGEMKNQLAKVLNTPCEGCNTKENSIQHLESKYQGLLHQIEDTNSKIQENEDVMKSEIDGLQEQVEELHKVRLDRENSLVELEEQLSDTVKKLKQYMENDKALRHKNDELEREMDHLNLQLRDHQAEIQELNEEITDSKKLEAQLQLERESIGLKSEELECKVEELECHINELSQMQDNSEEIIRRLTRELEERERNTNIHKDTAERLRKQVSELRRRQDEIIEEKSDESEDDGIVRILSRERESGRQGVHNVGERKKHGNKHQSLLEESNKRSNPEIEIVEDELLRMLLTQSLSLESFLERD